MSLTEAKRIVTRLQAVGVRATTRPTEAATLMPCILVPPPSRDYDSYCGYEATWSVVALAPPPMSDDSWAALDEMISQAADALPVEEVEMVTYSLATDVASIPAAVIRWSQAQEA